eukprot:COSAG05_NODE_700_length_7863_cov_8.211618_2_plen_287_part_00
MRNLHDGKPICPFRGLGHDVGGGPHYHPIAAWVPAEDSIAAMVRFHKEVTMVGMDGLYIDDFKDSFYEPWAEYVEKISAPPQHMQRCSHEHTPSSSTGQPPNCSSFFATDSSGCNTTLAALQAQFSSWRPVYTASLRRALGRDALLVANAPAPAVSDPSLNGITIEFEHCAGDQRPYLTASGLQAQDLGARSEPGMKLTPVVALNDVCRQTLLGQKALTDMSGLPPVFGLWLTHSEVMAAATQCTVLSQARSKWPWLREGDDMTDCSEEKGPTSCVHCNRSNSSSG